MLSLKFFRFVIDFLDMGVCIAASRKYVDFLRWARSILVYRNSQANRPMARL